MQRPELTHLIDSKGTGAADRYETVNANFGFSGNYHEFAYGPAKDKEGYLYFSLNLAHSPDKFGGPFMGAHAETPYRGWVVPQQSPRAHRRQIRALRLWPPLPQRPGRQPRRRRLFHRQPGRMGRRLLARTSQGGRILRQPQQHDLHQGLEQPRPQIRHRRRAGKQAHASRALSSPTAAWARASRSPRGTPPPASSARSRARSSSATCRSPSSCAPRLKRSTAIIRALAIRSSASPMLQGANRLLFAPDGSLLVGLTDRGWVKGASGIVRVSYTRRSPLRNPLHVADQNRLRSDLHQARRQDHRRRSRRPIRCSTGTWSTTRNTAPPKPTKPRRKSPM